MADLPGHSLAITSTTKLERFDEIRIHGKRHFENKFLHRVFSIFTKNNDLSTKLDHQILRETIN